MARTYSITRSFGIFARTYGMIWREALLFPLAALAGCASPGLNGTWVGQIEHVFLYDSSGSTHVAASLKIQRGPPLRVPGLTVKNGVAPSPPLLIDNRTNIPLPASALPAGESVEVSGEFKGWPIFLSNGDQASRVRPGKMPFGFDSAIRVRRVTRLRPRN